MSVCDSVSVCVCMCARVHVCVCVCVLCVYASDVLGLVCEVGIQHER